MRFLTIFLFCFCSTAFGLELNNLNKLKPCPKDQTAVFHNCWGTYSLANGNKYVGEFQHGKRNGQGTLTYAHGDKYVGEFEDGNYHGKVLKPLLPVAHTLGSTKAANATVRVRILLPMVISMLVSSEMMTTTVKVHSPFPMGGIFW